MSEGDTGNVTGVRPTPTCTRTAMYLVVPVKVPAREPMSSPETPKSHSLTTPCSESRMLDGLMSR